MCAGLKKHIPVKTNQWNETRPGFFEADTVAHCGTTLLGDFAWSITLTDICTGWVILSTGQQGYAPNGSFDNRGRFVL